MADPGGGGGWGASVRFSDYFSFLQKRSLLTKISINEYEICLKILEMVILETQIFKIFGGACPHTPPGSLRLRRSLVPPPHPFQNPGSAPVPISVFNTLAALYSIFAHAGSLKLYVKMLIGYPENMFICIYLRLNVSNF